MLEAQWRQSLVAALQRVVSVSVSRFEDAIRILMTLSAPQLLALDQELRRSSVYSRELAPQRGPVPAVSVDGERPETDAYLLVASTNPNGFIREQALMAFHHYPGRLAMAAALIRCDDWVPEVRQAATKLFVRLAQGESEGEIFAFLELLLLLRRRSRFGDTAWLTQIEPRLLSPALREGRWAATLQGNAESRWFAFRAVVRVDPDRIDSALVRAVEDGHPGFALWALDQSAALQSATATGSLLALARRHRRAAVRSEVLRREVLLDPEHAAGRLHDTLFDSARGPRNAAAFLLQRDFATSALDIWRMELDVGSLKRREIALAALSEHADSGDYARLVPYLSHSKARLRVFALRAVMRTKSAHSMTHLLTALSDTAPRVVGLAIQLIAEAGEVLDRTRLEAAYERVVDPRTRSLFFRAARLLGKWETLDVLLRWSFRADDAAFPMLAREFDHWLGAQNRTFMPLDESVRSRLIDQAIVVEASHPGAVMGRIRDALRPL